MGSRRRLLGSRGNVAAYAALVAGTDGAALVARFSEWLPLKPLYWSWGWAPGADLALLARHFARVTGSDRSRAFLQRYRARHPAADLLRLDAVTLEQSGALTASTPIKCCLT